MESWLGEPSFWDDIWFGHRPLSDLCPGQRLGHLRVSWFIQGGVWNLDRLQDILVSGKGLPIQLVEEISQVPISVDSVDVMRWMLTSHGGFSLSTAWDSIRVRNTRNLLFGAIWNDALTPTISIFL